MKIRSLLLVITLPVCSSLITATSGYPREISLGHGFRAPVDYPAHTDDEITALKNFIKEHSLLSIQAITNTFIEHMRIYNTARQAISFILPHISIPAPIRANIERSINKVRSNHAEYIFHFLINSNSGLVAMDRSFPALSTFSTHINAQLKADQLPRAIAILMRIISIITKSLPRFGIKLADCPHFNEAAVRAALGFFGLLISEQSNCRLARNIATNSSRKIMHAFDVAHDVHKSLWPKPPT